MEEHASIGRHGFLARQSAMRAGQLGAENNEIAHLMASMFEPHDAANQRRAGQTRSRPNLEVDRQKAILIYAILPTPLQSHQCEHSLFPGGHTKTLGEIPIRIQDAQKKNPGEPGFSAGARRRPTFAARCAYLC
jgi:hypothetical protein